MEFLVCLSRIFLSGRVICSWFLATRKLSMIGHSGIRIDRTPSVSFRGVHFLSHAYSSSSFALPD